MLLSGVIVFVILICLGLLEMIWLLLDKDDIVTIWCNWNSRFVIPDGLDETTVSDALSEAFNACQAAEMAPAWVQEAAVLNVSPTKTVTFIHGELVSSVHELCWIVFLVILFQDVFVMDPFNGPAFDHLTSDSKFRCTVVGPRCLLACLKWDLLLQHR